MPNEHVDDGFGGLAAAIVESSLDAIIACRMDGTVFVWSPGAESLFGYSVEEMRGQPISRLFPNDRLSEEALFLAKTQAGETTPPFETVRQRKNGTAVHVSVTQSPIRDSAGRIVGVCKMARDISERKQLLSVIADQGHDLKQILEHAPFSIGLWHPDRTNAFANFAYAHSVGHTPESMRGKHVADVMGPIRYEKTRPLIEKALGGQRLNFERELPVDGGQIRIEDVSFIPDVRSDGVNGLYVFAYDITARKSAEAKLRQSEATFAATFENAASGMAVLTTRGHWLKVNPALCAMLGYTAEQITKLRIADVTHPEEWATDALQIQRMLDGEIAIYQRAKRYLHRDGSVVWALLSASVVRDAQGAPEFLVAQMMDITTRKRDEEALAISSALMEYSQAAAKVGGWELNLETGKLFWTAETYRIYETTPDQFDPTVDAGVNTFLPGSRERIEVALEAAITRGEPYDLELEVHTTKGTRIDVRSTAIPTFVDGKVVRLTGIFQDITERVQYERSLLQARAQAEAATQSKGQFLANMSHEIRTPMNAILGMLKLLQYTELNARQLDYAEKSYRASQSLLGLINDILDFSKVEAGKMTLDAQPFRVEALMESLSVILAANVGAKGIDVLFDVDPEVPTVLCGDNLRLQQILINLAGNAVKFTSQGQVIVSVRLEQPEGIPQISETATVTFAVQDSGIGIAPENQAKIFSGFSQAEASTTRKFGGTGLGLAISQRLVELMGGTLVLSSALGEGSRFAFTLQLPRVVEVPPELQESSPIAVVVKRVLVVDDNPISRAFTVRKCRSWGWPTEEAESGEDALHIVQMRVVSGAFPFDVVFMDWQMDGVDGMDGWATAKRLRQVCAQSGGVQPVIVMVSANSRESLGQRTQDEQDLLNGFLVKPVTDAMLRNAALNDDVSRARLRKQRRDGFSKRRLHGMRILVVEDNLINQQVAEELLASQGALVALAANGRLGVDAVAAAQFAQAQFDVVLMDIQMPVLDGYGATRAIREDLGLRALPIVAMTANAMASDREDCLAAGMNDHVGKPFDLDQLVDALIKCTGYVAHKDAASSAQQQPAENQAVEVNATALDTQVPVVQHLELAAALARIGGNKALYRRAALDFLKTLPTLAAQLRNLLTTDLAQATMLAHTIKGNAGFLGAPRLCAVSAALERMAREGAPVVAITREALALEGAIEETTTALEQAIDLLAPPALDATNVDAALAKSALITLLPLLQAGDLTALEQFAQMRESLRGLPQAGLDAMEAALQALDLDTAHQICEDLLAAL